MKNQNILEAEITNLIVETFSRLYGNYEVFIDQQKRTLLEKNPGSTSCIKIAIVLLLRVSLVLFLIIWPFGSMESS